MKQIVNEMLQQLKSEYSNERPLDLLSLMDVVFQYQPVGITDLQGNITYANEKLSELTAYDYGYWTEEKFNILDHVGIPVMLVRQVISSGITDAPWRKRVSLSNNKTSVQFEADLVIDFSRAKHDELIVLLQNISQLESSQLQYKRTDLLEDVLAQLNIGLWEWDIQSGEVSWSENISRFMGDLAPSGEKKLRQEECFASIYADDQTLVEQAINTSLRDNGMFNVEYRINWPDNTIHWVQRRGYVIRGADGKPLRMTGVMFDITERKHMEAELKAAKELAARQNKAKSEFLTNMSHELKTPLNAIMGFSQLIAEEGNITEDQQNLLGNISRSGEHLNSLISEILDLAAIEAGQIKLDMRLHELVELLNAPLDLIDVSIKKQQQELFIDLQACDDCLVNVDKKRFTQIMLNLLSNAVKYNRERGRIWLGCEIIGDYMRLNVRDEGQGLNQGQLDKLFQPFQRLGAEKTDIKGSGMGLVITRQLVESMQGHIGIDSTPGSGSTFWVELPFQVSREK